MIDVIHNIVYTFLDKKLNPEYLRGFWKVLVTFLKAVMKPVTKKKVWGNETTSLLLLSTRFCYK